jgi:hypothetical protein
VCFLQELTGKLHFILKKLIEEVWHFILSKIVIHLWVYGNGCLNNECKLNEEFWSRRAKKENWLKAADQLKEKIESDTECCEDKGKASFEMRIHGWAESDWVPGIWSCPNSRRYFDTKTDTGETWLGQHPALMLTQIRVTWNGSLKLSMSMEYTKIVI